MKTLYVSDLDGTLLRGSERTSGFTNNTINELVGQGLIFSYATARSFVTAHKAAGFTARFPVIVYNGAMMIDNADGSIIGKNFFGSDVYALLDDLFAAGVYPLVYAFKDGRERYSFIPERCSADETAFIKTRNDARTMPVGTVEELTAGEIFYISCIGFEDRLPAFYEKYRGRFRCLLQRDIYTNALWLEIMPKGVTKAAAVVQLKEMLGCDRVVAFGDAINDLDMFKQADECYAVANAAPELKKAATGVIGSNEEDGVAKWLKDNARIG
ncbi:MAG: HAD family hydrolase [Ruminococcus sp.]|nr:HAD family hydrolase [Ruminococcus sp.]